MSIRESASASWIPTIGLEIHARLLTRTKAFCGCEMSFGAPPNSRTCPVCLGYPGSLPVLSDAAVRQAVRSAVAFRCSVGPLSRFDRKNYFYPDLPKGYQITQAAEPFATGGWLEIPGLDGSRTRVELERIHIEEDAGKSSHLDDGISAIDFNRAGAPLIEIVTRPSMHSPEEAAACFSRIRQMLMWAGTCDGNMEEGSVRCDANISVSRPGEPLGVRVEIKNLNSFRFLSHAVEYEIQRQIEVIRDGGSVTHETRLYDPSVGVTRPMRSKEDAPDYRFFPEPDLHALSCPAELVSEASRDLPRMPDELVRRYTDRFGFDPGEAEVLASTGAMAGLFDATLSQGHDPRAVANWIRNDVVRVMKERRNDAPGVDAGQLGELVVLTRNGTLSSTAAREVLSTIWGTSRSAQSVVEELGLAQNRDVDELAASVARVTAAHPDEVAAYRAGRTRLLGFFVGLLMKEFGGKADPKLLSELVKSALENQDSATDQG